MSEYNCPPPCPKCRRCHRGKCDTGPRTETPRTETLQGLYRAALAENDALRACVAREAAGRHRNWAEAKDWTLRAEAAERETARLRDWIREEGKRTDTCTYHILGREICPDCRCSRMPNAKVTHD